MRVDPEKAPERGVNPCQRDWAAKAAGEPAAEIFNDNPTKYTEPVSNFTVHMEMGMLAFVRADAIFTINGEPRNNNLDYFL